jgi:hypothetical protein
VHVENYMQKINPNLIIVLHYVGKILWLVLAAIFGLIGYSLYALGIRSGGSATATLPLGLSFKLDNAGPGLIVMVVALMCSLVGAVKSKVRLTPEAISITAPPERRERTSEDGHPNASDPGEIDRIETLQYVWGLTEVAQLYRTPIASLVSKEEALRIANLQSRLPRPENWWRDASPIVRDSGRFQEWLRDFSRYDPPIDTSLPWCIRLRWGSGVTKSVDLFVYATIRKEPNS